LGTFGGFYIIAIIQPKEECNYSVTITERAIKYLIIAAYQLGITQGAVSKESID
jgi:hypothetical protein